MAEAIVHGEPSCIRSAWLGLCLVQYDDQRVDVLVGMSMGDPSDTTENENFVKNLLRSGSVLLCPSTAKRQ
jgi:hypothetical protein